MDRAGTPADESARRIAALYALPGQDTFTIDGLGLDHEDRTTPLARHPRKLDVWGLHVQALPESAREASPLPSTATPARGTLQDVAILDQPGLPMAVSWNIAAISPVALLVYLGSGRRRDNPAHRVTTSSGLPPLSSQDRVSDHPFVPATRQQSRRGRGPRRPPLVAVGPASPGLGKCTDGTRVDWKVGIGRSPDTPDTSGAGGCLGRPTYAGMSARG
jgi:hypothetical protein